jgi:predicted DNA-binding protein with PD1-like motif
MTTHIRQVNPAGTRVYMGTLSGGVPVHESLAEVAQSLNIQTATFELLGGLTEIDFTAYDFTTQTRLPPVKFIGGLEICAGHGTISLMPDDSLHIHTHLLISWREGEHIRMAGGHCARAIVYAVEFTLTVYDGAPMRRATHTATGLMLWDVTALKHSV